MLITLTILAYLLISLLLLVLIGFTVVFRVMLGESWRDIWRELSSLRFSQIPYYFISSLFKALQSRRK